MRAQRFRFPVRRVAAQDAQERVEHYKVGFEEVLDLASMRALFQNLSASAFQAQKIDTNTKKCSDYLSTPQGFLGPYL